MKINFYPLQHDRDRSSSATADAALEFGSFRVLLRRRQPLANGVPVVVGTRAFDLLLVLLEADGLIVTKEELLNRVWPGIVVSEENLKDRSPRFAKRSPRSAMSSEPNSATATDSAACSA